MGKLATLPKRAPKAAVRSKKGRKPDTVTATGGAGYSREAKSELFLLAATNMVGEKTFHEASKDRDSRFVKLVRQVALGDPDWVARFVPFLRDKMNMRSASIVMAAELVHSKLTQPVAASTISNRTVIDSAIRRADEPAEMLGYWMNRYGKNFPMSVKRGVADAVTRLYSERNVIKWDSTSSPIRFADVIELTHPEPKAPWQGQLFKHILDRRHNRLIGLPIEGLPTLSYNLTAMGLSQDTFKGGFAPEFVESAALTWEQASSKYGTLDAHFWEAMIPEMGIFALVRNLRNFDKAKISTVAQAQVVAKMTDAEVIAKSRMFPLRFFSALSALDTMVYHQALEEAITLSLQNVPVLTGKTLILVDLSPSMDWAISDKSKVKRLAPASIFAAALAVRAEKPTLAVYSLDQVEVKVRKDQSVLLAVQALLNTNVQRNGTFTWRAVRETFKGHDRVIIVTDEQAHDHMADSGLSDDVKVFTFNVAGYRPGHAPSGRKNRYTFGGLTDAAFGAIEMIERGQDSDWPF